MKSKRRSVASSILVVVIFCGFELSREVRPVAVPGTLALTYLTACCSPRPAATMRVCLQVRAPLVAARSVQPLQSQLIDPSSYRRV